MSGWTDPEVIAQMARLSEADDWSKAFQACDQLDKSSSVLLRTLSAAARTLTAITREITVATRNKDYARAMEMCDGLIIALASCYASMLDTPDPAAASMVKGKFEAAVSVASNERKKAEKRGRNENSAK